MNTALWISVAALVISFASFANSWITRRDAKDGLLYERKRLVLSKAVEIELEWQSVLNELYHFRHKAEHQENGHERKAFLIGYCSELEITFTESHRNAKNIRIQIEDNFSEMENAEAKMCLARFGAQHLVLVASKDEMVKKMNLLATMPIVTVDPK